MAEKSWLNDAVRIRIEAECLKIEAQWGKGQKPLVALFSAYAEEYCAAGAPDGDAGPLEDIPALVYETAVNGPRDTGGFTSNEGHEPISASDRCVQ